MKFSFFLMFVKKTNDCPQFPAGDATLIRELLHPANDPFPLAYSLAEATLPAGGRSKRHYLGERSEVYYIMEGTGEVHIDQRSQRVTVGDLIYIPAKAQQHIVNTGDGPLRFLCIVAPAWSAEDDILQE